jgi:competence transcription factor ComK
MTHQAENSIKKQLQAKTNSLICLKTKKNNRKMLRNFLKLSPCLSSPLNKLFFFPFCSSSSPDSNQPSGPVFKEYTLQVDNQTIHAFSGNNSFSYQCTQMNIHWG